MLKWKFAALLGLAMGVAGVSWGRAQQQRAPGFYEHNIDMVPSGSQTAIAITP